MSGKKREAPGSGGRGGGGGKEVSFHKMEKIDSRVRESEC